MRQLYIPDRSRWRRWLSKNHDKEENGIWLVFYKKKTNKSSLEYEQAVEEAICFGWIDSIIKKIDEAKYVRKFTPRKADSFWSQLNKKRVGRMIKQGLMTEAGLVKIKVTFYFGLGDLFGKETRDIELRNGASIKDVLQQLCDSEERRCALFNVTGSINPLINILKSGKTIGDLNHILKEGDWIDVVPGIGGG